MQREIIATDKAPGAVGPYSQAVRAGGFVFTAGQIALDPASGQIVEGDIQAQTRQVLKNLRAVLEAADTSLSNVVKTTVFLADMGEFKAMNEVYAEFFSGAPPARSTVQAGALPLGARIEIEAVAIAP
ncbi:MAG: RidA family protein [Anaerolineales bacterium]|nr:MAG: RidA family protein [Anaerolineales bacterium]